MDVVYVTWKPLKMEVYISSVMDEGWEHVDEDLFIYESEDGDSCSESEGVYANEVIEGCYFVEDVKEAPNDMISNSVNNLFVEEEVLEIKPAHRRIYKYIVIGSISLFAVLCVLSRYNINTYVTVKAK